MKEVIIGNEAVWVLVSEVKEIAFAFHIDHTQEGTMFKMQWKRV